MDEKALEAACEAWVRESVWNKGGHLECLRAAITAYLAASGEARDADRYRWERQNPAWETEAYLGGMTPEQYDAALDAARDE